MQQIYIAYRRDTSDAVDFPVEWENEAQAGQVWRWDTEHGPLPLTPLAGDVLARAPGMELATVAFGGEARGQGRNFLVHGFRYSGRGAGGPANPDAEHRFQETVSRLSPQVHELWTEQWWPQIDRDSRAIEDASFAGLSVEGLRARLEDAIVKHAVAADYHFRASYLTGYARRQLIEFLTAQGVSNPEILINDLLQGVGTVGLDSSIQLWDLAQRAKANPELATAVRQAAATANLSSIERAGGGDRFIAAFRAWLDRFGRRNGSFGELMEATWYEDPGVALSVLGSYLESEDPRAAYARATERRAEVTRELEGLLPAGEQARLHELLNLALPFVSVKESRLFALNGSRSAVRRPALELGRALTRKGILEQPDDLFYLHLDELDPLVDGGKALGGQVAERRADYAHWFNVIPPESIGGPAQPAAPLLAEVRGIAASAGTVRGIARVILTLDQGHRLAPGDVLVTTSTTTMWTPLFGVASAIVTDGGGMLSHCAIVAREYKLPAVIGTRSGTSLLRDGMLIEVDGTHGVVRVVEG